VVEHFFLPKAQPIILLSKSHSNIWPFHIFSLFLQSLNIYGKTSVSLAACRRPYAHAPKQSQQSIRSMAVGVTEVTTVSSTGLFSEQSMTFK
jgi:hypothetical protein